MTDLAVPRDPATCAHKWWLRLYTTGRRVRLECAVCTTTDMQVWGPGGVADLVTFEVDQYGGPPEEVEAFVYKIKVASGQHNSLTEQSFPVNLRVTQSTRLTGYRSGGPVGFDTDVQVNVEPRWSDWD